MCLFKAYCVWFNFQEDYIPPVPQKDALAVGSTRNFSLKFKEVPRYQELPVQVQDMKQAVATWRRGAAGGSLHKVAVQPLAFAKETFQKETGS